MNNKQTKVPVILLSLFLLATIFSCKNEKKTEAIKGEIHNSVYFNELLSKIHTRKDLRDSGWLAEQLITKDKDHLFALFNALSSCKDSGSFSSVYDRIQQEDIDEKLFLAGMNALGNLSPKDSSTRIISLLKTDLSNIEQNATLESIGKIGSIDGFDYLRTQDISSGVMAGLYRSYLNGNVDISVIEKAVLGIQQDERETRFWSSHILLRQRDEDLTPFIEDLIGAYNNEKDLEVKIALARSFRKTIGETKSDFLKTNLELETEPLVLVNLLGSVGELDFLTCHKAVLKLTTHPFEQVSLSATNYLSKNNTIEISKDLKVIADQVKNPVIKGQVLQMISELEPSNTDINNSLLQLFDETKNLAQKASIVRNIAANENNLSWIKELLSNKNEIVLQGTAHESILKMTLNPEETLKYINLGFESNNVAMICQSAGAVRESENTPNKSDLLNKMNAKIPELTLPREMEALVELKKSIAHLEGETAKNYTPKYNHAINWKTILQLPNRPIIELKTSKGIIKWELYLDKIPAAVSTIVNLVDSGFYDNKIFHRVVPNFVAQGGCPRGDGWGSLDFTLRSEFDHELSYQTGAIGLASAGEDTESCQFFMCHSPTPHLDNRYTIIGNVIEGLDILNEIELGDEIITMKRLN